MTIPEVIQMFIKRKILILEGEKYVLAATHTPKITKDNQDFEILLEIYAELWPKKIKSGNRLIRRSPNSLRRKLKAFTLARKDVTADEIIAATKIYLTSAKRQNWEYTISADYFISKNSSSELESHVDLLKEGELKSPGEDNLVRTLN